MPTIFNSETELIDKLKSEETKSAVKKFFDAGEISSISEVVRLGADGSTFRAFRKLPKKPSVVFRMWTEEFLDGSLPQFKNVQSKEDYRNLVHKATIALCQHWDPQMCEPLGYGRGSKLLNLVFKQLACLKELDQKQKDNLIKLQHVPLDSYTIRGLMKIAPEFNIPLNATMKFIETPEQYRTFQSKITDIAGKAGTPAIYYDILAWNLAHQ